MKNQTHPSLALSSSPKFASTISNSDSSELNFGYPRVQRSEINLKLCPGKSKSDSKEDDRWARFGTLTYS